MEDHINPLKAQLNPISHPLALLGARSILHVSGLRVKMDLYEVRCEGIDWIELGQDRDIWQEIVIALMNFRVP